MFFFIWIQRVPLKRSQFTQWTAGCPTKHDSCWIVYVFCHNLLSCLVTMVKSIRLHVSGYMYPVTCIRLNVFWLHVSDYMYPVKSIRLHLSGYMYPVTCIRLHVSCYMYPVTRIRIHVSGYMYPVTCIRIHESSYMYPVTCYKF